MIRERKHKSGSTSSPPINANYQFVHMPLPNKMNNTYNPHHIPSIKLPIDRIVATNVNTIKDNNINILPKKKNNSQNYSSDDSDVNDKRGKHKKITNRIITQISPSLLSRKIFSSSNKLHNNNQHLQLILVILLIFCIFLIISLCSPDLIGIDNSFQELYYPQSNDDHFIFIYGSLIFRKSENRKYIHFTPKSLRINPHIHDHFNPNNIEEHAEHNNDRDAVNNLHIDDGEDMDEPQQFPVRIHHLKRGFYFDTSFNDDNNNEGIIKIDKKPNPKQKQFQNRNIGAFDVNDMNKNQKMNHSYTSLGVQFDENYDITVNGILLRIDEKSLLEFDINYAGAALKRESIPLQWIDFLYTKPVEFINMELDNSILKTIKKETIDDNIDNDNNNNDTNDHDGVVDIKKEDIEDANSMIKHDIDIEIEVKNDDDNIDEDNRDKIEVIDLIDAEQGVIVEDDKNINKINKGDVDDNIHNNENELSVINEENQKKYALNVWTYIVPIEIMIDENNAQYERIMKQSYIDIVLAGCLDIGGNEFAKEFISTTYGWTPFAIWNDDRGQSIQFKHEEEFITEYEHKKIDQLLQKYVFGNINK